MHTESLGNASENYSHLINNPHSNTEQIDESLQTLLEQYNQFLENNLFNNMNAVEREFAQQFINDIHPHGIHSLIPCMMNCAVVFYNLAAFNFLNKEYEKAQIWCELANGLPDEFLKFHQPLLHGLKTAIVNRILHGDAEPAEDKTDEIQQLIKFLLSQIQVARKHQEPDFFKKVKAEPAELKRLENMAKTLANNPSSENNKRFVDAIATLENALKAKNILTNDIKKTFVTMQNHLDQLQVIKQKKLN